MPTGGLGKVCTSTVNVAVRIATSGKGPNHIREREKSFGKLETLSVGPRLANSLCEHLLSQPMFGLSTVKMKGVYSKKNAFRPHLDFLTDPSLNPLLEKAVFRYPEQPFH